jgi:hypothetical protein
MWQRQAARNHEAPNHSSLLALGSVLIYRNNTPFPMESRAWDSGCIFCLFMCPPSNTCLTCLCYRYHHSGYKWETDLLPLYLHPCHRRESTVMCFSVEELWFTTCHRNLVVSTVTTSVHLMTSS